MPVIIFIIHRDKGHLNKVKDYGPSPTELAELLRQGHKYITIPSCHACPGANYLQLKVCRFLRTVRERRRRLFIIAPLLHTLLGKRRH